MVRQAFDIFLILFFLSVMSCDNPRPQPADLQMQAYLGQFQKAVLNVQFVQSKTNNEIVLLFNQPMVDFANLHQLKPQLDEITFTPKLAGVFEWIEPQVLVFRPKDVISVTTTLTIAAGWQSLLGTGLLRDVNFELSEDLTAAQSVTATNEKPPIANMLSTTDRLFWPRNTEASVANHVPTVLELTWQLPPFLNVGDHLQARLKIRNASSEAFTGHVAIVAEQLLTPLSQNLDLPKGAQITIPLDVTVAEAVQADVLQNFLANNSSFLEKVITITCVNGDGTQVLQKPIKIYSTLNFENKDYLGVLAGVQKQQILNESFLRLKTGQLSLDFSLDARELLNSLVQGLKESPTDDLFAKAMSLAPYVIFPKSTLAFGQDADEWQTHLDDVQQFLEELDGTLQIQVGRVFSGQQLLRFGEFVALARETGFVVNDLQTALSQLLLQDLADETNTNQKIAILWVLSRLKVDQTASVNEAYLSWAELDPLAQMQLADMILKLNPLHPVAKLAKRSVDKILFNQTPQPVMFWAQAFRTLVLLNPDDNLNFEVFAQIFSNLENHRSLTNDYAALIAFQLYQAQFTKIDKPVDLAVTLNGHEIMKSHLSWKNRSDGLILPVEKLPQQVVFAAQKNSGPFAFYRLHLKGLRLAAPVPIEDYGIRVTQSCYDANGQPQTILRVHTVYSCRVRWVANQAQDNVLFEIPRLTGANLVVDKMPQQSVVAMQGAKLKVFYPQLAVGYGEFDYQLRPDFTGQTAASTLNVSSTLGGYWGGRFRLPATAIATP